MAVKRTAPGRSATSRALGLLDAFDDKHRVLTLSQIARRTSVPLATAHRLVHDLADGHLLLQRADGRYEIGARTWQLGLLARPTSIREAALPHLQDLVLKTGQTVHMGVRDGQFALVIDRLARSRSTATRHLPGSRLPLHCTALGNVLLAFAPERVQGQVLAHLDPVTPYTVTDREVLRLQLDKVRRNRLAASVQQNRLGIASLAVPVFSSEGTVVAAIAVIAPAEANLAATEEPLRSCAHAVARTVDVYDRRWYEELTGPWPGSSAGPGRQSHFLPSRGKPGGCPP